MTTNIAASAGAPAPRERALAAWKPGVAMAGVAGIASFQKSLLPRSGMQQAFVTAASAALGYGVGVGAGAIADKVDRTTRLDAAESRLVLAGAGGLAVLGTTLALRGRPNLALEAARTSSGVLGAGALLGAALIGEQVLVDRIEDRVPGGAAAAHAAIFGAAALGTAAVVLGRARATAVTPEAEAAYLAAVGGPQGRSKPIATFDAARFEELSRMRAEMTTVSGKLPGTRLPDGTVGKSGFRFLSEVTPAAEIARTMGVDPSRVKDPIRIYGGLNHAATPEQLAQKIFDEALDHGAFDRRHLMLYLPSGTGHVNPMAVAATEYLTLGDVASVGMQYHNRPSVMSLHKIRDATELFERVQAKFLAHVDTLPAEQRPTVVRYGESLGGISMLRAFDEGGAASVGGATGGDKLLAVGTPGFSRFRREAVGSAGYRLDASRTLLEFDNLGQVTSLPAGDRAALRSYLLAHYNDPVSKFSPTLMFHRPGWLSSADEATGIPRKMKWVPGVTGVQSVVDTMNGAKVVPGILERTGHDYRADLAPVMAEVLGIRAGQRQMTGIVSALNQLELARVHGQLPAFRLPPAG